MAIKKNTIVKWLLTTLWVAVGAGTIVLLVAAVRKKDAEHCRGLNILIKGVNNDFFVDKKDIVDSIAAIEGDDPVGRSVGSFNLKMMENKLKKNIWVKDAELFFDNNEVLQVKVTEREPVARIFTTTGTTFYIDTAVAMLPLSEKFSARLPVFTDFPSDKIVLTKSDSDLLKDIRTVSLAIQSDTFCMALIDQVDITPQRTFEFIPKIGSNIIVFGDATNAVSKLNKIKLFYKKVMIKAGWDYYTVINVQYKNQIVAKRKGADDKTADSLRTIQMMQQIAANAERMADDSLQMISSDNGGNTTDSSIIQQSMQRDESEESPGAFERSQAQQSQAILPFVTKPTAAFSKPVVKIISKPIVAKPIVKPTAAKKPISTKPIPVKPFVSKAVAPRPNANEQKAAVISKPKSNSAPVQTTKPLIKPKPVAKKKTEPNNDY